MPLSATESLIAVARDPSSTDADVQAAVQAFVDAVRKGSPEEANAEIRAISKHLDPQENPRAAFLALVCGALIEQGCDPMALAPPLIDQLAGLLDASARLCEMCVANMPDSESRDEEDDPMEAFETARRQTAATHPDENAAWEALRQFWTPAIAVLSRSAEARASARHLRDPAEAIAEQHEAGHWLSLMLKVLTDEPIVAIEPQTKLGILGRISGVVDNFQLNVLLMDAFPKSGLLARRRVPQRVADVARGKGPQQTEDIVTGVWNMYAWEAVRPDGALPDPNDYGEFWIWNEGTPEDIPVFDGRRVILLGPASYPRSWNCQRMFEALPAELAIEHKLSKSEVRDWLKRLAAAKQIESP